MAADYVTFEEAEIFFPDGLTINESSEPTEAQMDTIISYIEGEVNVALISGGYTSPVPSTDVAKYRMLKLLVATKSVHMAMTIRGTALSEENKVLWDRWDKKYEDTIKEIKAGTWAPPNIGGAWSRTMLAPTDVEEEEGINARITRDTRF